MKINNLTTAEVRQRLQDPKLQAESMCYDIIMMFKAELKPGRNAAAADLNESAARSAFNRFSRFTR
jgi:hypothetical protein